MTAPALFVQEGHRPTLKVEVLAGRGALIRAFTSGGSERAEIGEHDDFTIGQGQTYACVNTGEDDLLLQGVTQKPLRAGRDEVRLVRPYNRSAPGWLPVVTPIYTRGVQGEITGSLMPDRSVAPPERFYELIDQVAGGRVEAWS